MTFFDSRSAFDPRQLAAAQAAYAEPPRAYHDFGHVEEVMRHAAQVSDTAGWAQPREVALAILYHDAVYVAGRQDNEIRSAEFAVDEIARWMPGAEVDAARVAELVVWTARHGQWVPDDFPRDARGDDSRRFLDCDMAILGAAPDAFDRYDRGIATEYRGVVPGWLFKLNRRRFLKALLAKPRIFLSDDLHARLDAQARHNLRRAVNAKR